MQTHIRVEIKPRKQPISGDINGSTFHPEIFFRYTKVSKFPTMVLTEASIPWKALLVYSFETSNNTDRGPATADL